MAGVSWLGASSTPHHRLGCTRELGHAGLVGSDERTYSVGLGENEALFTENLQMPRHGRLAHVDGVHNLADGDWPAGA